MHSRRLLWRRQVKYMLTAALAELQNNYEQAGKAEAAAVVNETIAVITGILTKKPGRPKNNPEKLPRSRPKFVLLPRDKEIIEMWMSSPTVTCKQLADHYHVSKQRIAQRLKTLRDRGYDLPRRKPGPPPRS